MKLFAILSVVIFAATSTAFADESFVCDNNGNKRIVSIVYQDEGMPVPCEVRYDKGEGEQTLWNAQSEVGYCEARADEFVEKQESWGWSCAKFETPVVSDSEASQLEADEPSEAMVTDQQQEDLHTSTY